MRAARLIYRTQQFWHALGAVPASEDLEQARELLNPAQMALFQRMQPSEQAHSLRVLNRLRTQNEGGSEVQHPDLLVAALLHDTGKIRHPLRLWERVWIVIGKAFFPKWVKRWIEEAASKEEGISQERRGQPGWLLHPFIVAELHPLWGAEMAAEAGASPLTVALIRRHQNLLPSKIVEIEDRLLQYLQAADGSS